jgi:hypothetical protein
MPRPSDFHEGSERWDDGDLIGGGELIEYVHRITVAGGWHRLNDAPLDLALRWVPPGVAARASSLRAGDDWAVMDDGRRRTVLRLLRRQRSHFTIRNREDPAIACQCSSLKATSGTT